MVNNNIIYMPFVNQQREATQTMARTLGCHTHTTQQLLVTIRSWDSFLLVSSSAQILGRKWLEMQILTPPKINETMMS